MKNVKIQIRVAPETRERWKSEAGALGITLTSYIEGRMEAGVGSGLGASIMLDEFGKEVTFTTPEDVEPDVEEFRSYFK